MGTIKIGSTRETCLFCIPIRPGVLVLLVIALILNLISLSTLFILLGQLIVDSNRYSGNNGNGYGNTYYSQAIATVAVTAIIYTCMALFLVWGLWSAYKKNASHFKVFTIVYAILTLISFIMIIWNAGPSSIISSVISIYWVFVCYCYWKVISGKGGEKATRTHPNESAA